jgi:CPA1 family monovalent cation:H+ antiporter
MVAASIGLPRVLRGLRLPPAPELDAKEVRARVAAAEAAIHAIEKCQHDMGKGRADADVYADAGARVMDIYRRRIDGFSKTGKEADLARHVGTIERELRLTGLRAERDEISRLARGGKISDEPARKLVREIDLLEARISMH